MMPLLARWPCTGPRHPQVMLAQILSIVITTLPQFAGREGNLSSFTVFSIKYGCHHFLVYFSAIFGAEVKNLNRQVV